MNREICEKIVEPLLVATIRYTGRYDECGKYFSKIYKEAKFKAKGTPFLLCYDNEYKKDGADIEVCIPISTSFKSKESTIRELPRIKGLSAIHAGGYDTIHATYDFLCQYVEENPIETYKPSREIYLKGPGMFFKGDQKNYRTEIIIPIKES